MFASPVPTHSDPSTGSTARAPMDKVGIESNTGVQVWPWLLDRHTPPSAAPANQVPSGVVARAVIRPLTMEKPVYGGDCLARVSDGVFRLDGQLLVVLDVDRVLDFSAELVAA